LRNDCIYAQAQNPNDMKRILLFGLIIVLTSTLSFAQYNSSVSSEVGISVGSSSFLGDLGGANSIGRAFVYDLDLFSTRPAIGIFFRQSIGYRFALRFNGYYARVWGDDALTNAKTPAAGSGWHRYYRNLSFRSYIIEASVVGELNLLPFEPGSMNNRFTPYIFAGAGAFRFDPKAYYNGSWVRLQPLGTEGQGLIQYPEKRKYSLIQLAFPMGVGVKTNLNSHYTLGFEIGHRVTTTDYIDDVSTTYPDPAFFYANYPPQQAALAAALSDRSTGEHPSKTAPGQQRGDPSDNDSYFFTGVTLSYTFSTNRGSKYYCPKNL